MMSAKEICVSVCVFERVQTQREHEAERKRAGKGPRAFIPKPMRRALPKSCPCAMRWQGPRAVLLSQRMLLLFSYSLFHSENLMSKML